MLSVSLWSRKSVRTAGRHEVQVGRYAYSTNSERTCGGAISIGSSRIEGRRKDGKSADGEGGSYSDHAGRSWSKPTADGTDGTRRMCSGLRRAIAPRDVHERARVVSAKVSAAKGGGELNRAWTAEKSGPNQVQGMPF